MVFGLKVLAKVRELPKCPRNVISDDYRLIPLRRRKFEVIPVLDHDFRGHQSWEDWDLGEIGYHLLRILKPLQGSKSKWGKMSDKIPFLPNHGIFVSRSSLDLGSVSMDAHGLYASCRSD